MKKRLWGLLLVLVLVSLLLAPAERAALAAGDDALVPQTESVTAQGQGDWIAGETLDIPDSDTLFSRFVDKQLKPAPRRRLMKSAGAGNGLTGLGAALYAQLSALIPQVANGELGSTEFRIATADLGAGQFSWTAGDLELETIYAEGGFSSAATSAAWAKITQQVDFPLMFSALQADNPYNLYWFDKTQRIQYNFLVSSLGETLTVDTLIFCFPVLPEYAVAGQRYAVDASVAQLVDTVKTNANAIVNRYADKSDYEKLDGYRKEICTMVSYNKDAMDQFQAGAITNGNPWQLLWVFDNDPTTNVVCEGYAKAFQYLCDLTNFSSDLVRCITVSGVMNVGTTTGDHMWNHVRMEDGHYYLVDVTNCEEGHVGAGRGLFLVGLDAFRPLNVSYGYDGETRSLYEESALTLHETKYHKPGEPVRENEVPATWTTEGSYDEVVYCTICHEELSREHKVIDKLAHDHEAGEPVQENVVPATCIADGSYDEVVHCTICGELLSTEHVEVEKTGVHTPGAPVRENEVKATTTARGHYDEAVYCTVCGEELSREEKVINKSIKGLTITGEPEDAKVKNGEKAKFTVKISGKATAIQWYYRTYETAKWKKVSSKGNKLTLTVTGKPGNDGYQYRCELKNGKKKLYSDTVTLDVELFPPTISSQPESAAIQAGEEATFTFGVEGEGVTYAWSYRKSETGKWAAVKGGTGATLTVTGKADNAGYQYKCEAKNKDGSVTSDIVTLDVEYHLPEIVTPPKGVKVKKNAKVTFTVEANDPYEEELTFQWYYRKSSKAKWTKIKGATERTYSFKATAKKSGYQYKCDVTNHDGTVSTKAVTLKVK